MSSGICSFLSGRSVFVTGGTGFAGRSLIGKLVVSCPDIAAVYVLVRAKKGVGTKDRLAAILASIPLQEERLLNKVKA